MQQLDTSSTSQNTLQQELLPDYPADAVWLDAYLDARGRLQSVLDLYVVTPIVNILPQIEQADGFSTAIARAQEAFSGLPTRFTDEEALPAICQNVRDLLYQIAEQCEREQLAPLFARVQSGQLFLTAVDQARATAKGLSQLLGDQTPPAVSSEDAPLSGEAGQVNQVRPAIGPYQLLAIALVNVAILGLVADHTWGSLAAAIALVASAVLFARQRPDASAFARQLAIFDRQPFLTTLIQICLLVVLPLTLGLILHIFLMPIVSILNLNELFHIQWKKMGSDIRHFIVEWRQNHLSR